MLRCRTQEHIEAMGRFSRESFIIEHCQDKHGMSTEPPKFRFRAIKSFKDCLSRQLCEALTITEKGRLNRKHEYINNELIKLEVNQYSWEIGGEEITKIFEGKC